MKRTAAIIVNYNMPERTDALVDFIDSRVHCPVDIIVVDNGSNLQPPSKHTSLHLAQNLQTTAGWLMGLRYADALEIRNKAKYGSYWFLITSAEFVGTADPLTPLVEKLEADKSAVACHPALTPDSTTSWEHMKQTGVAGFRSTFMVDNIASLYRTDWFNQAGRFDPALVYAWGIDLETCWKARRDGRTIWINEDQPIKKISNIGYTMGRMNMTAEARQERAGLNMTEVLFKRYGPSWWDRMMKEFT